MFLLPETVVRQDGMGAEMQIDAELASGLVRLTLGITRIIAKESLDVSVWGSVEGKHWDPLIAFPQKFYCGTYSIVLDLARHRDVRYLRAQWRMGRWLPEEHAPLFEFYLRAEDALLHQAGKVATYAI
jgi:hypothetical protein